MENSPQPPQLLSAQDMSTRARALYDRYRKARAAGAPLGPVPPLPKLAHELGGCWPDGLSMIAGPPGSGKSALAIQSCQDCCFPSLYVTCELSPEIVWHRTLGRLAGQDWADITRGTERCQEHRYSEFDLLALDHLGNRFNVLDATRSDVGGVDLLRAQVGAIRADTGADRVLVVVDSLHAWTRKAYAGLTEYEALAQAVPALVSLGLELETPIIALAEQSKANQGGEGQGTGAGHRVIEYGADVLLNITLPKDANGDRPKPGGERAKKPRPLTILVAKNRYGFEGATVPVEFDGRFQRFMETPN